MRKRKPRSGGIAPWHLMNFVDQNFAKHIPAPILSPDPNFLFVYLIRVTTDMEEATVAGIVVVAAAAAAAKIAAVDTIAVDIVVDLIVVDLIVVDTIVDFVVDMAAANMVVD
jgi:hypothetical protein